jgi:hypothetical protein
MSTTLVRCAGAALLATTLAACGGGSTPTPASDHDLPAGALASAKAFLTWMTDDATARDDDGAEPLALGTAMPPASDTTEPAPLR